MKCPVCRDFVLESRELEPGLAGATCPQCRGWWLGGSAYLAWVEGGAVNHQRAARPPGPLGPDSTPGKFCPEGHCGHFLRAARVGPELEFTIQRCGACGGLWLDAGEWDALKDRTLEDDLHRVFSDAWQTRLAHRLQADRHAHLLQSLLGDTDLGEIRRIKSWLDAHPHRAELYAFLLNPADGKKEPGAQGALGFR